MKQRGRSSSIEVLSSPLDRVERQPAPHDLSDEETEVWVAVVNSMPAEWFTPSTVPLLTQYCRHSVHARRIAELLAKAVDDKDFGVRDYNRILRMQQRESMAICTLATKMRIAQQSTISDTAKKTTQATARKPWQR